MITYLKKTKYRGLFLILGIHLALFGALCALLVWNQINRSGILGETECVWAVSHLYCPGCGGTRAVKAILDGDLLQSLIMNPNPLLWACTLIYVDIRTVILFAAKKDFSRMYFSKWLFILLLGTYVGYFFIRNILMIFWNIDPLGQFGPFWERLFP